MEKTELYETFQKGLTSVNGESYIAKKADVAATLTKIFQDKDTHEVALVETPLLKEIGAVDALKAAGIKVDTDHFRKNAPDDKGGVTEADYGIAGGKDCGLLFRRGEILGKYPADKLADALVDLILSEK